ncbi:putative plus-end-directed kinesin ATPase [Dioscorea sansibarensis]
MRMAGEEEFGGIGGGCGVKEERMLVSVRMRPLNSMEIARNELSVWECISNTSIIYQNKCSYEFDRVFGCECTTKQVYEDAAKEVVLSVVNGVNSSVFAYGQTSSGKTYTMNGITECSVADIYEYMERHEEREFVLKFSAIEIYNEAVRDLLSTDASPLRVLDDPERGTIVEKLREETVRNEDHLKALLLFCQAQRQIKETSLNEMSSRSHQILRLTIESSTRRYSNKDIFSTLSACVNFIDLAGSERASQVLSEGTRLKEGSHINRSLLTLGTVIRKLSKGRNGHIPYRDSKLTRILQSSLGGNARTAIICTISPVQSHFEQSRNTLLFATCARDVVTSARVNVVMSDKTMVKHLQNKLARLETELRYTSSASATFHSEALRERDARIRKMEKEMKELIQQRDLAQSRLEDLLLVVGDEQASREWDELSQLSASYVSNAYDDVHSASDSSFDPLKEEYYASPRNLSIGPMSNSVLVTRQGTEEAEQDSKSNFEDLCKEVQCIEIEEQKTSANKEFDPLLTVGHHKHASQGSRFNTDNNLVKLRPNEVSAFLLVKEEEIQNVRTNGATTVRMNTVESDRSLALTKSRSCRAMVTTSQCVKDFHARPQGIYQKNIALESNPEQKASDDVFKKPNKKCVSEDNITSICEFVTELKEIAQVQYQIKTTDSQELEQSEDFGMTSSVKDIGLDPMTNWLMEFEKKRREIIELWHACNVSLIHRTYFFLLFKGDPADSVYMEVERRRLLFLKNTFFSSMRNLRREREMLCRQMRRGLSGIERERLYSKWGIKLCSKKRRMHLTNLLWSETENMEHVSESASLVAKLTGFLKPEHALKEMFGLSFTPQLMYTRSCSCRNGLYSNPNSIEFF